MWWVKQRVLSVERARVRVANWEWEEIWKAIGISVGLGVVAFGGLTALFVAAAQSEDGRIHPGHYFRALAWAGPSWALVTCWVGYNWWSRIVTWAKTSERVVERLQGR